MSRFGETEEAFTPTPSPPRAPPCPTLPQTDRISKTSSHCNVTFEKHSNINLASSKDVIRNILCYSSVKISKAYMLPVPNHTYMVQIQDHHNQKTVPANIHTTASGVFLPLNTVHF